MSASVPVPDPPLAEGIGLRLPQDELGQAMPERSADVLGRMNFESPYVDMPMRLTVRQNLTIFGRLYAVKDLAGRIEQLASDLCAFSSWAT